jgi:hypothetical protein
MEHTGLGVPGAPIIEKMSLFNAFTSFLSLFERFMVWSEDPCRDATLSFGKYTLCQHLNSTALEHPLREFSGRVSDYNMRDLSNDSDALNAFVGTSNILSKRPGWESGYLFGLPVDHFENALLWQSKGLVRPRLGSNIVFLQSWSRCFK